MSNKAHHSARLRLRFESPLLIGGYRTPPGFADAATAVDSRGAALVPASALKGALREACTLLLRERGEACCDILAPCGSQEKEQHDPQQRGPQGSTAGPPAQGASAYCAVCQLFGATGVEGAGFAADAEDRRPSARPGSHGLTGGLRLRDAHLPGEAKLRLQPGVALDRQRGAATPGLLFLRQVLDATGREVEIPLSAQVDSHAWQVLCDAVPLLTRIGAGRSRGLGRISATLEPTTAAGTATAPAAPHRLQIMGALDGVALVEVEALEPLSLGGRATSTYVLNSLHHLPGATLRAAIAAALVDSGVARDDVVLQDAFMKEGPKRLRFSDALRCAGAWQPRAPLPLPVPKTVLACPTKDCKYHADTLLLSALAAQVLQRGGTAAPQQCPLCKTAKELKPARWSVDPEVKLRHRFVTRVGLDPQTGSAMPGMLYTVELLDKGTRFLGTVAGLTPEVLALLPRAKELRVGRGRSRGQGLVQVTLRRPEEGRELGLAALAKRRDAFLKHADPLLTLARELGAKDLPAQAAQLVPVLLRTALAPAQGLETVPDLLAQAVWPAGAEAPLAVHQQAGEHYGYSLGFDSDAEQHGPRAQQPVARAGSVYLLRGAAAPDLERLARLESDGLGELRHLGLGILHFYPRSVLWGLGQS